MIIKGIEVYHPRNLVKNNYYLERFTKQQMLLTKLFNNMKKEERYISEGEDSLTMATKAIRKALDFSMIDRQQIGAVFYVSQTPEYVIPTNAVMIHKEFKLNNNCFCADVNSNCAGMTTGFELAYSYFKAHEDCQYILLVGSDYLSKHSSKDSMITYAIFGDAACAVVLQRSEGGFLDSEYYANSENAEGIRLPSCGLSQIYEQEVDSHMAYEITHGSIEAIFGPGIDKIEQILERNHIDKSQIALVCCNQQTRTTGEFIINALELKEDKMHYVGDQYGYTGCTASFISLYHGLQAGKVKQGDYIVFCSAGAGGVLNVIVYQYMEG